MAFFPFSQSGTTEIAPAGVGASAIGYRVQVTGSSDWVGSILIRSNTAPPGNVPSYQNLGLQNPSTREELPAGTPITTSGAWIVSVPPGNLVATYTHTAGVVNVTVSPATAGVTDSELAAAFTGAGFRTYGQDTPVTMLSAAVATLLGESLNVLAFGAVGDGVTDDTEAIQRAIDAAPNMGIVFFPPPSTSYLISSPLILKSGVTYQGTTFNTATIKLADGADPVGMLCSENWYNNADTSGSPITIRDLHIDGNSSNNTTGHGIILTNFRCLIERVQVRHVAQTGILFSEATRDTTLISNTMVENVLSRCFVSDCGEYGVYCVDSVSCITDGWLQDCAIESVGLDSIRIDHATGWAVEGNHFWGTQPQYAIRMRNCDKTRIRRNYVERYGSSVGTWEGIFAHCFEDVVVAGNIVTNENTTAGATFSAIRVTTAGTTCRALVEGNQIRGNNDAETALIVTTSGGGTMVAHVTGNQVTRCATAVATGTNTFVSYGENQWDIQPPTFTSLDTTPSVNRSNLFRTANAGATSITDFDQAVEGQSLTIFIQDNNTTIVHNASLILLNGGVDFVGTSGDSISFRSVNGVWIETARMTV